MIMADPLPPLTDVTPRRAPLLEARDLHRYYRTAGGRLRAVEGVSLSLQAGETVAVVGESGCGKSTLARTMALLQRPTRGTMHLDGAEVSRLSDRELRSFRRDVQYVFQDPAGALDPRWTVGRCIGEPLLLHKLSTRRETGEPIANLLDMVGLPRDLKDRHQHELSGGQRQRVGLARALAVNPRVLILDEPVSAVNVSAQAQVITLLQDLQNELKVAYLFIVHDLPLVRLVADWIAVMYLGKIVEAGPRDDVYGHPRHPYTEALLSAVPVTDPRLRGTKSRIILGGDLPSPLNLPTGCRFRTRCPRAQERCAAEEPELDAGSTQEHQSACHFPLDSQAHATSATRVRRSEQ